MSSPLLFGRDATPGIVSVSAGRDGVAYVWRRAGQQTLVERVHFANWFLLSDARYLGGLPVEKVHLDDLLATLLPPSRGIGLVELKGDQHYRYLVAAAHLGDVEQALVENYNKSTGAAARNLGDLRDVVYMRPPTEQYLILSGRTYFKGMSYSDLRRLQFDLETTGLDENVDRVFMISVSDSTGFRLCLDTSSMSEKELLEEFVRVVQERDPDVLENHNIFEFDLKFLVRRAAALGVRLALGRPTRPGGTPGEVSRPYRDTLKVGENTESFSRYSVYGREIIDTLHAVRRYGAIVRDMRNHGLKAAARYFGVAREDREYVEGAEVWPTFQKDPDRVRRYGLGDVEEVNELSRVLMASSFALASMVPKPYERVATSGTGQGLIEPLLVRAYVTMGHSLPGGRTAGGPFPGARTELFTSGVVRHVVKVDVASLYPSVMLTYRIGPESDRLGVFLALLKELTELRLGHKAEDQRHPPGSRDHFYHNALQAAMKVLINSFYGSLGAPYALFGDTRAAAEVTRYGRDTLALILQELERRGVVLVEADTDGVLFAVPEDWTYEDELRLVEEVGATLPEGIRIEHDGRYAAMYSYAEKNYVLQGYDGSLKIVGVAFKSSRNERFGEQFLAEAAPLLLAGDLAGLRHLYRSTVARLRARAMSVEDVCTTVALSKSPDQYRKANRREEQYEVLRAAGRQQWRPGQRVSYYQARDGRKKLVEDYADDYDAEYYVQKLRDTYCQRLAKALTPEDFQAVFSEEEGLFQPDLTRATTLWQSESRTAGRGA